MYTYGYIKHKQDLSQANVLMHHGIDGQKWGQRNGPPYPLDPEDHSAAEKRANHGDYSSGESHDNPSQQPKKKSKLKRAADVAIDAEIIGLGVAGLALTGVGIYGLTRSGKTSVEALPGDIMDTPMDEIKGLPGRVGYQYEFQEGDTATNNPIRNSMAKGFQETKDYNNIHANNEANRYYKTATRVNDYGEEGAEKATLDDVQFFIEHPEAWPKNGGKDMHGNKRDATSAWIDKLDKIAKDNGSSYAKMYAEYENKQKNINKVNDRQPKKGFAKVREGMNRASQTINYYKSPFDTAINTANSVRNTTNNAKNLIKLAGVAGVAGASAGASALNYYNKKRKKGRDNRKED